MSFPGLDWQPIRLAVAGRTHAGRVRRENQDRFMAVSLDPGEDGPAVFMEGGEAIENPQGPVEFFIGSKGFLLMVADGMGGAAGGALASGLAARAVYEALAADWIPDHNHTPLRFASNLKHALETANYVINERAVQEPEYEGMGTTATAVGVLENFMYLAQVGDSRAYLLRAGSLHQLTRDQSVVQQMVDAGTMTEEEAENAPGGNLILQAIGAVPTLDIDVTYLEARRGDVLLVCSDGLYREVRKEEIAALLASGPDLEAMADGLLDLALEREAADNITVLLARFDGEGLHEADPGEAVERQPWTVFED